MQKEFNGKNQVKARNINKKSTSSYDIKTKQVEYKKTTPKINNTKIESTKIVTHSNDENEWESF